MIASYIGKSVLLILHSQSILAGLTLNNRKSLKYSLALANEVKRQFHIEKQGYFFLLETVTFYALDAAW